MFPVEPYGVKVPIQQIDPDAGEVDREFELGPARLPVLLRVSDYARAFAEAKAEGRILPVIDYLGHQPWGMEWPEYDGRRIPPKALNGLCETFLRRGEAVVVFDGLDEVMQNRPAVVFQIEEFIRIWINARGRGMGLENQAVFLGPPGDDGGNQVIITSRVAGYYTAPVSGDLKHLIIQPMKRNAVERFARYWMRAVFELRSASSREAERAADQLINSIYRGDPYLPELASNPLLVTILAIVFLHNDRLPGARAELYERAVHNLLIIWVEREQCRSAGLSLELLLAVLPPLAAYMHTSCPNGQIGEGELGDILALEFSRVQQLDADDPKNQAMIDAFLSSVRESVGLIAEFTDGNHGFIHRTFEEYLAARHLVTDRRHAAQEIIRRLDDPQWHEPIILALGIVSFDPAWRPRARIGLIDALLDEENVPLTEGPT